MLRKWLNVGWVEEGKRYSATVGTPQGSVISALLANIYLNEVMDHWVSRRRKEKAQGDVIAVRYVNDAVFDFRMRTKPVNF